MEGVLHNKKERFANLLHELNSSIAAIEQLRKPGDLHYKFELGNTLYAAALIPDEARKVGLWLGAGIMLEYDLDEALQFLANKRDDRTEEIRKINHDLHFLKRQITTMEVNVARLYNRTVKRS